MKYIKYVSIVVAWIIELVAFTRFFHCWLFTQTFYFTRDSLTATLINSINDDKGMPLFLIRMLHNKVLLLPWGLGQALMQYWDGRFLEEFIGVVGAFGVLCAMWYLVTKHRKNILGWVLVGLGILLPLTEIYIIPHVRFEWRMTAISIVFQALSLFGIYYFLSQPQKKWRYIVLSGILVISLLFLFFLPLTYQNFCLKI